MKDKIYKTLLCTLRSATMRKDIISIISIHTVSYTCIYKRRNKLMKPAKRANLHIKDNISSKGEKEKYTYSTSLC